NPDLTCSMVELTTRGDELQDRPLASFNSEGVFVKELESALLGSRADIAVHSMKDMPLELPAGVRAGVVPVREDARDVLLSRDNKHKTIFSLPNKAVVGTSSLRRAAQVHSIKPAVEIKELRGNVDTRIAKLLNGEYDAIILALAGVKRLGNLPAELGGGSPIPFEEMVPAVGQGALFVQCRESDKDVQELIAPLNDPQASLGVAIERAFLERVGGGCAVPIGANANVFDDRWLFHAFVGSVDGKQVLRRDAEGIARNEADATVAVEDIAEEMLEAGARWVMSAYKGG
ncbi:MAG: hydroxymethylbilane synthase, partial [Candidatus Eremiobacteraeota bacterium]|nr:hydroxymethylbilane synthase [Candidatus Eremiobacteraeota bacterium]